MTFEKPVDVKQVIVEGLNLPPHEVKDRDSRSVVIAFLGDILDKSLKVRIDSSVGAKAEVAKSDTPAQIQQAQTPPPPPAPAPRPLSGYEAEQKIIAIDKVLKILSNDMQVVIDKYPSLQNWWNALKDPANNPDFGARLLAFRDEFKAACLKLDSLKKSDTGVSRPNRHDLST